MTKMRCPGGSLPLAVVFAIAVPVLAAGNWPPRFTEPQLIVHGGGADVGPICVPALWPQVQVIDWNHDGHDDLWVNQPQHIPHLVYRNLKRWHNGSPVFAVPDEVVIGPGAVGDLDGDGRLDWIGVGRGTAPYTRHAIERTATGYQLGEQLPLFEASAGKPLAPSLYNSVEPTLRIVDWDGDGRNDLLCGIRFTGYSSPLGIEPPGGWGWPTSFGRDSSWLGNDSLGAVVWHKNVGPPTNPRFTVGKPVRFGPGQLPLFTYDDGACDVADLDRDGRSDLIVCTFDRLLWFRNEGGPGMTCLSQPRVLDVDGQQRLPFQRLCVNACDLNEDRLTDLILHGPGFAYFAKNIGSKSEPRLASLKEVFQTSPPVAVDGFAVPAVADLNADGLPDLVVGTEDGLIAYFENAGQPATTSASDFEPVPYDGKRPEVAAGPAAPSAFKARVYLKADGQVIDLDSTRGLTGPLEELWGYTGVVVTDWDLDGDLDLLTGCVGPFITFYENVGDAKRPRFSCRGKLKTADGRVLPNGYRVRPATVDADGNGMPDLLAINLEGHLTLHLRTVNADLTMLRPAIPVPDATGKPLVAVGGEGRWNGRTILSVVDWDRDGDWDLIAGMRSKGERLRYYENVGTARKPRLKYIGPFPTKRPGGHYQMAEFFDFDGDGLLDVVAGSDHGLIYYFRQLQP